MRGVLFVLRRPRQILGLVTGFIAATLYVWFAAVRAVPEVKKRKAAQRKAREEARKP